MWVCHSFQVLHFYQYSTPYSDARQCVHSSPSEKAENIPQFIFGEFFFVLVMISIRNMSFPFLVGIISGVLMHSCIASCGIAFHNLEMQPLVTSSTYLP